MGATSASSCSGLSSWSAEADGAELGVCAIAANGMSKTNANSDCPICRNSIDGSCRLHGSGLSHHPGHGRDAAPGDKTGLMQSIESELTWIKLRSPARRHVMTQPPDTDAAPMRANEL